MAKSSGLGQGIVVAGYSIPNDVASVMVKGGPALLDMTGLDKSAHERIGGLLDGGIDLTAFFNDAADRAHPVLKTLPTTDVIVLYHHSSTLGAECACMVGKELDYGPTRAADGSVLFAVPHAANGFSLEWANLLTAGLRTDTSGTNGASVDGGAASATGWAAYAAVIDVTGTNVVLSIEDSADNASFAAVTGGAFTSVTVDRTSERIAGAAGATLRRYVRVVSAGTFSSATFIVAITRHPVGASA